MRTSQSDLLSFEDAKKATAGLLTPQAVECLQKELRVSLSYYEFPNEHWKSIRTTNALEGSFRKVWRRTRPTGGPFVGPPNAYRTCHSVFRIPNNNWTNDPVVLHITLEITLSLFILVP